MIAVKPALAHLPIWEELVPYIDRQLGQQNNSRFPLKNCPPVLLARALAVQVPCCHCNLPHHPVRHSESDRSPSIYVSGPRNNGHKKCSYGNEARSRVLWMKCELEKVESAQRSLLDGDGRLSL